MNILLNKLIGLLKGETELLESLLLALQKEKGAVIDSNLESLNKATKEKENLVLKIRILEEQRMHLMERIAGILDRPPQFLNLTQLSQLLEAPYSDRLEECSSNILALTQSIQDLNRCNKGLLTHSLDLVRDSLSLFDNLLVPHPVYYRTGKLQMNDQTGKVLSGKI